MYISQQTAVAPFLELGLNLLMINMGMGYGIGMPNTYGRQQFNGFIGVSAPIFSKRRGRLFYLQAYYRPIFSVPISSYGISHEMGLMFKWMWAFDQIR